jgi:hypothetical protein
MGFLGSSAKHVSRALAAWLLIGAGRLWAHDAFVVLSGGIDPWHNGYSQFLEARAMADFFQSRYPPGSVWVFFGAGNAEGKKPVLADVHRVVETDGIKADTWMPGALAGNRPATRSAVLRALNDEILPSVRGGGTLFLFVGDHGAGGKGESAIRLWSLRRDPSAPHGWGRYQDAALYVSELRRALASRLGSGRVVFCMTQCFSGGFHSLGLPPVPVPEPGWFLAPPDWAPRSGERADLLPVAGFTATDGRSAASGCYADPGDGLWAGYERCLPECLLGLDLITDRPLPASPASFFGANAAAELRDRTLDKPISTSDQFLAGWADLIDEHTALEPGLTGHARSAVDAYRRAVDGQPLEAPGDEIRKQKAFFDLCAGELIRADPGVGEYLHASREELEGAIAAQKEAETGASREPGRPRQLDQIRWRDTIMPAWRKAVESGTVAGMTATELEFERGLLADGRDLPRGDTLPDAYWASGYGDPGRVDPERALEIGRWSLGRADRALDWCHASEDPRVRQAAEALRREEMREADPATGWESGVKALPPVRKTWQAIERLIYFRRVLAAWQFLLMLDDKPALAQLDAVLKLERTPLPPPSP